MKHEKPEETFHIRIKPEHTIIDLEALKAFCDPLRHKIMQVLSEKPLTIREIAEKIHRPFTNLYYHINILEKHELIYIAGMRPISGAVAEKYYHVCAKVYRVQRQLSTFIYDEGQESLEGLMDTSFDLTRQDIHNGIENGIITPDTHPPHPSSILIEKKVSQLSPEQAQGFYQQVLELLNQFDETHSEQDHHPTYALTIALHPLHKR
jgi:DNA-binding transcriptional ArsR family regulator